MPIGTSIRPELLTFPARAKVFVPLLVSVPYCVYHSAPFRRINGRLPSVSTFWMIVGLPQSPQTAGNGGRGRGIPRRPSIEAISAVSSPQTNAPAPRLMVRSKENPEPSMFSPRRPSSRSRSIATSRRRMARGYSIRQ